MVLVDSSIWIEAFHRNGKLEVKVSLENLLDEYEALWCGPVKLEVLGAARHEERNRLLSFFECIPYRPMTDSSWDSALNLSWQLRDKGVTVPWNDVLIASLSKTWNLRLYAVDKHFEMIQSAVGLRLYYPGIGGKFSPE